MFLFFRTVHVRHIFGYPTPGLYSIAIANHRKPHQARFVMKRHFGCYFDEISGSMRKSIRRRRCHLKLSPVAVGLDKGARD